MPEYSYNRDQSRYEATVDGQVAAFIDVRERSGRLVFTHTETAADFAGQGVAAGLTEFAVRDGVDRGMTLVPYCPYTVAWLQKHPEFEPSVSWPPSAAE